MRIRNSFLILLLVMTGTSTFAQVKKVLLEEMSTTLCSFCPVKSADLVKFCADHPNAIAVTHHAGFGTDAMTGPADTAFSKAFSPFHFPSMTIDRIKFDSVPGYYSKYVGVSMMAFKWQDSSLSVLNNTTPEAVVQITQSWNSSTRKISGEVRVEFLSVPDPGKFRINLYILEDSVSGDTGNYDYDQKNNYINDPAYPELYGKIKIQGYVHRNVCRAAPLGNWGTGGIIPDTPAVGNRYTAVYDYTVPMQYDIAKGRPVKPNNIKLVGFVSYHDANTWKRKVLNSEQAWLNTGSVSFYEGNDPVSMNIYPNPCSEYAELNFSLSSTQEVKIFVSDMSGRTHNILTDKLLQTGTYTLSINSGRLPQGTYLLTINCQEFSQIRKFIVIH